MANINRPRQKRLGNYAKDASATEIAAKMELKIAKLKMQMAAAKLQYLRATAAYQAAMSGQDAAKTNPSFSTRSEKCVKSKGLQEQNQEQKERRRSPSYQKRLQRRRKERVADSG